MVVAFPCECCVGLWLLCPIHFVRLEETDDWHILYCPRGHYVNRDYASVMSMNWKLTPEAWVKGVLVGLEETEQEHELESVRG